MVPMDQKNFLFLESRRIAVYSMQLHNFLSKNENHILDFSLNLILDKLCQYNPDAIKNSIVSEILKVGYLIPKVIQDRSVNA